MLAGYEATIHAGWVRGYNTCWLGTRLQYMLAGYEATIHAGWVRGYNTCWLGTRLQYMLAGYEATIHAQCHASLKQIKAYMHAWANPNQVLEITQVAQK